MNYLTRKGTYFNPFFGSWAKQMAEKDVTLAKDLEKFLSLTPENRKLLREQYFKYGKSRFQLILTLDELYYNQRIDFWQDINLEEGR